MDWAVRTGLLSGKNGGILDPLGTACLLYTSVDQSSGKYSADSAKQIADQLKDYGINVSASGTTLTFTCLLYTS